MSNVIKYLKAAGRKQEKALSDLFMMQDFLFQFLSAVKRQGFLVYKPDLKAVLSFKSVKIYLVPENAGIVQLSRDGDTALIKLVIRRIFCG